jgi:hypothetical protein
MVAIDGIGKTRGGSWKHNKEDLQSLQPLVLQRKIRRVFLFRTIYNFRPRCHLGQSGYHN